MDEDAQKTQFMTLIAEGEKLYNNGEPDKALEFYAQALTLQPADKHALVARSKCYLRIGNVEAALNDAENSLKGDKLFHRGLFQKAEALYQKGDFELALVNFHRGSKKRPELDQFRLGIEKSKEAIINSLGASEIKFSGGSSNNKSKNAGGDERVMRATKKYGGVRNGLGGSQTTAAANQRSQKTLLAELYPDKEYLGRLEQDLDLMNAQINDKEQVRDLVRSGLDYFESRTEFWRQQKPLYSRKLQNSNTSPASDPVSDTLRTIKLMEDSQNYIKAIELAEDEIKRIGRCTEKQLQQAAMRVGSDLIHKQELECELSLAAGRAASQFVDSNPNDEKAANKAKSYFNRTVSVAVAGVKKLKQERHREIMKEHHSRALFELGHLYVVTNKLCEAISVWEDREQLIANQKDELVVLYHDIGRAQLSLNNFNKAREYANLSYNMVVDPVWKMNVMVLLAEIHLASKQIDQAKRTLENCLVIAREQNDHGAEKAVTDLLERLRVRV